MKAILDASALVAIDRRDREVGAKLRVYQRNRVPVGTSSAVVAQVWRDGARQANLARVLRGVASEPLDETVERQVGELLGSARTSDVVDAHIALIANDADDVLTGDADDIRHLLDARNVAAGIVAV
jgi:hypothetical protein